MDFIEIMSYSGKSYDLDEAVEGNPDRLNDQGRRNKNWQNIPIDKILSSLA